MRQDIQVPRPGASSRTYHNPQPGVRVCKEVAKKPSLAKELERYQESDERIEKQSYPGK